MVMIRVHAELGVNQENFSPVQFCKRRSATQRRMPLLLVAMAPPGLGHPCSHCPGAPLWDAPSRGGSAWHSELESQPHAPPAPTTRGSLPVLSHICPKSCPMFRGQTAAHVHRKRPIGSTTVCFSFSLSRFPSGSSPRRRLRRSGAAAST